MKESFAGKTVLITGASAGIGAALAVEFAKRKANLVLNGRKLDKLQVTKNLCVENGCSSDQVVLVDGDIVEATTQNAIVNAALNKFGKIDILVNNAGATETVHVMKLRMKAFDDVLDLNLRAPVGLSLLALPHLAKTNGNIVNVSSLASVRPVTSRISYSTSKAALDMFTKSLAFNVARLGVRVNSVNPGVVPTNFGKDESQDSAVKAKIRMAIKVIHPLGRVGKIEEVTNAILFLASEKTSFTTGQIFYVDGGAAVGGIGILPAGFVNSPVDDVNLNPSVTANSKL